MFTIDFDCWDETIRTEEDLKNILTEEEYKDYKNNFTFPALLTTVENRESRLGRNLTFDEFFEILES